MEESEHKKGTEISGKDAWASSRIMVVDGQASVVLTIDGRDIEVAAVKKGDSFGWDDNALLDESWNKFRARIVVGEVGLRTRKGEAAKAPDGLSGKLGDLWCTTSPTSEGIAFKNSTFINAQFLTALWMPLLHRLSEDLASMWWKRENRALSPSECFPLSGPEIDACSRYVHQLTEVWYGSNRGGNLSCFHTWFMKSMETIGVMKYRMDTIGQERTKDGWAVVVDGSARAAALKNSGGGGDEQLLPQKQGRSAIDNTVLRNLYMPFETRLMFVGDRVKQALCHFIRFRQVVVLRKLCMHFCIDPQTMGLAFVDGKTQLQSVAGRYRVIRSLLQTASADDFQRMGICADSLAVKMLRETGVVVEGYDSLGGDGRKIMNDVLPTLLNVTRAVPSAESDDIFEKFIAWNRDHPGQFYQYDKQLHRTIRFAGHFSNKIVMLRRSVVEKKSLAKYFKISWFRQEPLWGVWPDETVQVRRAKVYEASSVRANEAPYCKLHGMSLSSGAFTSDKQVAKTRSTQEAVALTRTATESQQYSELMEFQMVQDPTANLQNWFFTDIEKILNESWQLNVHGPKEKMLPWEAFVNVGQNPKVGSSIQRTQHTQLCSGSLTTYPVFQLSSNPQPNAELGGTIDFVEIAPDGVAADSRGLFIKVSTEKPTAPRLVNFLVNLRKQLLERLGGANKVDFFVMCMSDEQGGFVVIFACLPQLEKLGEQSSDFASWKNPLTGETTEDVGLNEARIDFGKGVGHFLVLKPALRTQVLESGEAIMRRIWAFNRVPGSRKVIEEYMDEWSKSFK